MNSRKFYMVISAILLSYLFIAGIFVLNYANKSIVEKSGIDSSSVFSFLKQENINILFLVGDKSESNTDTMMVINYDPTTSNINLLSIPRDTKVNIKASPHKINAAYAEGGPGYVINKVSTLLNGINIKYYVYINISTFREVVDLLGGVEFDVPVDLNYDDPTQNLHIHLEKGPQHLNGAKSEQLLRYRKSSGKASKETLSYYSNGDARRTEMQQNFLKEIIKQKVSVFYLSKIKEIIKAVFKNTSTNMTMGEVLKILSNDITGISAEKLTSYKLSGEDTNDLGDNYWYFIYNHKILNVSTGEDTYASDILKNHFMAAGKFKENSDNSK